MSAGDCALGTGALAAIIFLSGGELSCRGWQRARTMYTSCGLLFSATTLLFSAMAYSDILHSTSACANRGNGGAALVPAYGRCAVIMVTAGGVAAQRAWEGSSQSTARQHSVLRCARLGPHRPVRPIAVPDRPVRSVTCSS